MDQLKPVKRTMTRVRKEMHEAFTIYSFQKNNDV